MYVESTGIHVVGVRGDTLDQRFGVLEPWIYLTGQHDDDHTPGPAACLSRYAADCALAPVTQVSSTSRTSVFGCGSGTPSTSNQSLSNARESEGMSGFTSIEIRRRGLTFEASSSSNGCTS